MINRNATIYISLLVNGQISRRRRGTHSDIKQPFIAVFEVRGIINDRAEVLFFIGIRGRIGVEGEAG